MKLQPPWPPSCHGNDELPNASIQVERNNGVLSTGTGGDLETMGARISGDVLMGSLRDISTNYSGSNMCDSLLTGT
ncbi:uncharacterized protein LAJ45_10041 [Morchella importuna]|uniref:uncharacterized protein n=1 Tax=Morchella importuna TaxID=1174673 RepID=UPI001E8E1CB5|nr:uncharacterized protein LAJ45_10041 [Morchella importuna]KAH8145899.1 hypothetical protein LAJ45_10041 [Morchella importuna]